MPKYSRHAVKTEREEEKIREGEKWADKAGERDGGAPRQETKNRRNKEKHREGMREDEGEEGREREREGGDERARVSSRSWRDRDGDGA